MCCARSACPTMPRRAPCASGSDALPRRPISTTRPPRWRRPMPGPCPAVGTAGRGLNETDRRMPKMTFIERDGTRREVDAPLGLSVLEIAHKHGVDIEGACEGSLACSTCHVIVDPAWFGKLATPTEDEEDMLDLAFGLTETSRLGCQIVDDRGAGRAGGEAAGRQPEHAERVMRIVVAMSGGVDSSVTAGLLHAAGHEVIGVTLQLYDHGAATGRKGACCAGQDIHDARAGGGPARHPALRDRRRGALRAGGDRGFRRQLRRGRDAGALRALQPDGEVHRPDGAGARAGRGTPGDRPLCPPDRRPGRRGTAPRRGSGARPELVPVRHHARAAWSSRCSRWATCRTRRRCARKRRAWAGGGGQAGQPGHLLRAVRRLRGRGGSGCARMPPRRRDRRSGMAACSGGTTASRSYTVGQGKRLGAAAWSTASARSWWRSSRRDAASWSVRARTGTQSVRLREVNWLVAAPDGAAALPGEAARPRGAAACGGAGDAGDGAVVWLDAPALPAPGQACVFYDGDRVLGGGFIRRSSVDAAGSAALFPRPLGEDGGVAQR